MAGALYLAVGIAPGALARAAVSGEPQSLWRVSAFVISAAVFLSHVSYENIRRRATSRQTAWHAAAAVAFGGFALAVVANIHDLGSAAGYRPRMLIALVAWPALTAMPAFFVALVVTAGLRARQPKV